MKKKKIVLMVSPKEQESTLIHLACGKNKEQLFDTLREGYSLTAYVAQLIIAVGWKNALKDFLIKEEFDYPKEEAEKLAFMIIEVLGDAGAYNIFIKEPYQPMLRYISTEELLKHQNGELYAELRIWEPIIILREFKHLPPKYSWEWGPVLIKKEMYDEAIELNCISDVIKALGAEKTLEMLTEKKEWKKIYDCSSEVKSYKALHVLLDNGQEELLYEKGEYSYLISNRHYGCFVRNKQWVELCRRKIYDDSIDWDDFYRQNKPQAIFYARKGKRKDVLRRHGHWWKALFC